MWNWRRNSGHIQRRVRQEPTRDSYGRTIAIASVVVAIASLVVAGLSLKYSVDAQDNDKLYRELTLRPAVVFTNDSGNFRVSIQNTGLGPAEVVGIYIAVEDKCIYINSDTPPEIVISMAEFFEERMSRFMRHTVDAYNKKSKANLTHLIQLKSLLVGDMVSPGQTFSLFEMQPFVKAEFQKYDLWLQARTEFESGTIQQEIGYQFCSVSRRYCRFLVSSNVMRTCREFVRERNLLSAPREKLK